MRAQQNVTRNGKGPNRYRRRGDQHEGRTIPSDAELPHEEDRPVQLRLQGPRGESHQGRCPSTKEMGQRSRNRKVRDFPSDIHETHPKGMKIKRVTVSRIKIWHKAADMMANEFRHKLNAATMLGQGKTVIQAEIDSAMELIDFFRYFSSERCLRTPLNG